MPAATAAIDASRVPSHRPTAASGAGTAAAGTAEQPRPPQLGARLQRLAQLQQRLADEQQQAQHLSQQQRQELAEVQQQAAEERRLAEIQEQEHQALQEQFADEQLLLELQQHLAEPQEHAQLGEQLQRLATTQQQLAEVRRQLALGSRPAETQQQQQQEQQQQQQQLQLASAFFKRLHCSLTAPPAKESLVAEALAASSTDQPQVSGLGAAPRRATSPAVCLTSPAHRSQPIPSRPCPAPPALPCPALPCPALPTSEPRLPPALAPPPPAAAAGGRAQRADPHQPQQGPHVLLVSVCPGVCAALRCAALRCAVLASRVTAGTSWAIGQAVVLSVHCFMRALLHVSCVASPCYPACPFRRSPPTPIASLKEPPCSFSKSRLR